MKTMKKLAALLTALVLMLVPVCGAFAEDAPDDAMTVMLGSSGCTLTVPFGYYDEGVTMEDTEDALAAVYVSPDGKLDFDIFETQKTEAYPTLVSFMTADCAKWNGTNLTEGTINGIDVMGYLSDESYDGVDYSCVTYGFETPRSFVEVCFYMEPGTSADKTTEIMSTLSRGPVTEFSLGNTGLGMTVPFSLDILDTTGEESAVGLVSSFYSHTADLFIDVYEFSDEPVTLAEAAAAQAEAYGAVTPLSDGEINGIPAAAFLCKNTVEGEDVYCVVLLLENSKGSVTDVVFYLGSFQNLLQANAAIASLAPFGGEAEQSSVETSVLQLGDTGLCITLPATFTARPTGWTEYGENDLIAAYDSPAALYDFEVYEFSAEPYESLVDFNEKDAAEYNGSELSEGEINGIPCVGYLTREFVDDRVECSANFAFEVANGEEYLQICFNYVDSIDAQEDISAVLSTLAPIGTEQHNVGDHTIECAADFVSEDLTGDAENMTAVHFESPSTDMCFYAYTFGTELSLEDYAAAEAAEYGAEPSFDTVNGVEIAYYTHEFEAAPENVQGVLTVIAAPIDGTVTEIDFVYNGLPALLQAAAAVRTLA